ncbi:hypothetical protein JL721_1451 [Aureococcus anophagefferens]|nr:hypothetical protein JL721_1451 [Aureococcus anophagefferens]
MSSSRAAAPTGRPRSNSLEGSHGVVIAGSYEGGLHGWRLGEASTGELTFSFAAHDGCCRCVAASEKTLLSGGDDEKIRVYSLRSGRQVGELSQHKGTVTGLAWCGGKHAVSASADGTLAVWRASDWVCVHVFGGHKGEIRSLAPHPSGRMCLTAGADRTLRLWDLVEGRCAFITRTKGEASRVFWASDGSCYGVVLGSRIEVRGVEDNGVLADVAVGAAVIDARFLDGAPFVAACDGSGALSVFSADDGDLVWRRKRRGAKTPGRVKAPRAPRGRRERRRRVRAADAAALGAWAAASAILAATSTGAVETWRPGGGGGDDDDAEPDAPPRRQRCSRGSGRPRRRRGGGEPQGDLKAKLKKRKRANSGAPNG